mmetsp:Transcript_9778/g.28327  ORF Transcript_9778/g.28327 Transcript_9778/m.28327 type:complete len:210 (-) Transcript_9778:644-1273(-)
MTKPPTARPVGGLVSGSLISYKLEDVARCPFASPCRIQRLETRIKALTHAATCNTTCVRPLRDASNALRHRADTGRHVEPQIARCQRSYAAQDELAGSHAHARLIPPLLRAHFIPYPSCRSFIVFEARMNPRHRAHGTGRTLGATNHRHPAQLGLAILRHGPHTERLQGGDTRLRHGSATIEDCVTSPESCCIVFTQRYGSLEEHRHRV